MTSDQIIAVYDKLFIRAAEGKHTEQKFLRCKSDFKRAKIYKSGMKKIVKSLEQSLANLTHKLDSTAEGNLSKEELQSTMTIYVRFKFCKDYYQAEVDIISYLIKEYKAYLQTGHRLENFLNFGRPEKLMTDHLKLAGVDIFADDERE